VERPGVARAEDFTEIAFAGEAMVGGVTPLRVTGHDGKRVTARLPQLEPAE
jgi:threonylcarbamoyladenosine tRNA methylthiotransferase MtaB